MAWYNLWVFSMQTWSVDRSGLEDHFLPNLPHSHFWPVFLSPFFPNPLSPPRLVTEVSSSHPLDPSLPSSTSLPSSPQSAGSPWTPCWSAAHGNALGHGLRCFTQPPPPFFCCSSPVPRGHGRRPGWGGRWRCGRGPVSCSVDISSHPTSLNPSLASFTTWWITIPQEIPLCLRCHHVTSSFLWILSPHIVDWKRFWRATFLTVCLVLNECKFQPI